MLIRSVLLMSAVDLGCAVQFANNFKIVSRKSFNGATVHSQVFLLV